MKFPKNLYFIFRLALILPGIILITYLIIKAPAFFKNALHTQEKAAPKVETFGIIIPRGYSVHGIDVSKHQGNIDWKRVSQMEKNGVRIAFAYIKATEGVSRQDEKFKINWKQSSENGLLRGAYHFYYPSRDAQKQADNFIKQVKPGIGDLPPVVDIELGNGKSAAKICKGLKIYLIAIEKHYSVKPIIYTNINFYNSYLKGSFNDYPLWIAGYFDHDRFYNEFETPWVLWQHSEKGKVDGIKGNVDFNVFSGSLDKLKLLGAKD
jgi:lysozyme